MSTGTYYHPGLKILPLWTVSKTDYPSVTTKLVSPPPRCDAHLGETSIHQIQILYSGPDLVFRLFAVRTWPHKFMDPSHSEK